MKNINHIGKYVQFGKHWYQIIGFTKQGGAILNLVEKPKDKIIEGATIKNEDIFSNSNGQDAWD